MNEGRTRLFARYGALVALAVVVSVSSGCATMSSVPENYQLGRATNAPSGYSDALRAGRISLLQPAATEHAGYNSFDADPATLTPAAKP